MSVLTYIKRVVQSKHMLSGITVASVLESTVIPIPLEGVMIPLMQMRRDKIWLIALWATIGCIIGASIGYAVGFFLFDLLSDYIMQHLTTPAQFSELSQAYESNGFWLVFSAGVTPIPFQLAMLSAGVAHYPLHYFVIATGISRVLRYFGLAVLVYYVGDQSERLFMKYKWQLTGAVTLAVGMAWLGWSIAPS